MRTGLQSDTPVALILKQDELEANAVQDFQVSELASTSPNRPDGRLTPPAEGEGNTRVCKKTSINPS